MQASEIKSGRIYSWVIENSAEMLKTKTNTGDKVSNPLRDLTVTKRVVYTGQATTGETWLKAQLARNPAYTPGDRAPQHTPTENDCIVSNIASGELQVRITKFHSTKKNYFVGGNPATLAELATIALYTAHHARNDLSEPVMFPYLHNITNADNDMVLDVPDIIPAGLAFKPVMTSNVPALVS